MYEELVDRLRNLSRFEIRNAESVIHVSASALTELREIAQEAADAIEELERDLKDCRNELCLRCGEYKRRHLGACDSCRWLEVE